MCLSSVLPSYPLDLWKTNLISTVDVEQRNYILKKTDVKNIEMFMEKRIAFFLKKKLLPSLKKS